MSISEKIKHGAEQLASAGKTPLFFAKENRLLGMIAVADVIKEDSPQANACELSISHIITLVSLNFHRSNLT